MESQRTIVTSALPYANGPLHLGHIAGAYLPADIFVRYRKLRGDDIIFIGGTDEHGVPITLAAEKAGVSPKQIVDQYHNRIKKSFENLGINFTNFSRTTTKIHYEMTQDFFLKLNSKGYLKKKEIQQLYCTNDKMFLSDRYVEGTCPHCESADARGDQCESCGKWIDQVTLIEPRCKICGTTPEIRTTTHWFFDLAQFQKPLQEWLSSKEGWRDNVINFCNGWLKEGLEERAVTRDLSWGVPVPLEEADGKVIYVWFDAPIGYISSTIEWARREGKPDAWKDYWQNPDSRLLHFIGKDNIVFHAIFFPAMLHGYGGYVLPDNVPANEFLNMESQKFSTSRNFAVWVDDFLDSFPPDPLRFCLVSILPETRDSDFSWKDFQSRNNNELADILGNFVHRTMTFAVQRFGGRVPAAGKFEDGDLAMIKTIDKGFREVGRYLDKFEFRNSAREMMNVAREANKFFNDNEPWATWKTDKAKCATTIHVCLMVVKSLSLLMRPFLPFSAKGIWETLMISTPIDSVAWGDPESWKLDEGHQLGKPEILFNKIEDEAIDKEIQKLLGKNQEKPEPDRKADTMEASLNIDFKTFQKIKLRTARILEAEQVEGTDKLMKLQVDLGDEKRQIIAGIAKCYSAESLVNKTVIVVANLEPAKIRGEVSEGMLLAASSGDGLVLATTDSEIPPGSGVS